MKSQNLSDRIFYLKSRLVLALITKPVSSFHWRNSKEKAILKGKSIPHNEKKGIIYYAIHKSGSFASNQLLSDLARSSGYIPIDWEGYFATTEPEIKSEIFSSKNLEKLFPGKGFFFGALRNYLPMAHEKDFQIILQVRDPRDILTSHYFSMTQSHPVLTKNYLNRKMNALRKTIDEHVLDTAPRFLETFTTFLAELHGKENVLTVRYEDMVLNNEKWMEQILNHTGLHADKSTLKEIGKPSETTTISEDPARHKRKMLPGDHREKLLPETIEKLNKIFENVLRTLNYPI